MEQMPIQRTRPFLRVAAILLLCASGAVAQSAPATAPVQLISPIQDKNFYLLSLLERTPAARDAIKADPTFARIASQRLSLLDNAAKTCNAKIECYAAAFSWSDTQSAEAGAALAALYRNSPPVKQLIDGPLRASGMYIRYNNLPGDQMIASAWQDNVVGINRIIDVYGLGKPPRYPAIDSISYDPKSDSWHAVIQGVVAVLSDDHAGPALFSSTLPALCCRTPGNEQSR